MWARAIIFGIELVGFIILCTVATTKLYLNDKLKAEEKVVNSNLKFNIIYFITNFAIILILFSFTYPSFVFLSYSKLILVSVFVMISCIPIMIFAFEKPKSENNQSICLLIAMILFVTFFVLAIFRMLNIENKIVVSEQTETETITPTMFSENQIGYTADSEGNIKTYIFYYMDNGIWNQEEVNASDVKVEKIKDADSYIEKTVTTTSYCKQEKKTSEEDYIYSEETEKYTFYINLNQRVEIKTD